MGYVHPEYSALIAEWVASERASTRVDVLGVTQIWCGVNRAPQKGVEVSLLGFDTFDLTHGKYSGDETSSLLGE